MTDVDVREAYKWPGAHVAIVIPGLVFILPFIFYLKTLAPSIYPGDGPELTAAAHVLGIPHPTGYPLFMLLGFLVQQLGLGSPAFAMNLLCAFAGALACLAAYGFLREVWNLALGPEQADESVFRVLAGVGALGLGVSATWWDQSTQTEVYSLFFLFCAGTLLLGLRVIRLGRGRDLCLLALVTGLGLMHHLLIVATFPLTVLALWSYLRGRAEARRVLLPAVLLFVLPLAGYLYLPLRAAARPEVNWGDPRGLSGIVWHLSGGDFKSVHVLTRQDSQGNLRKLTPSEWPGHLARRGGEILRWGQAQLAGKAGAVHLPIREEPANFPLLSLILLLLGGIGWSALVGKSGPAAWGLLGSFGVNLLMVLLYTIPDIQPYQMPLWMLLLGIAPLGFLHGPQIFQQGTQPLASRRAWVAVGLFAAMAGLGIFQGLTNRNGVDKAEATQAYMYAEQAMKALPPESVVFTMHDYDIYPLWYAQTCLDARPDVAVIGANFIFSGWYRTMLETSLPPGVQVFIGDEPPSTQDRWLIAFAGGMLAPQLESGRPVYITSMFPELPLLQNYLDIQPVFQFPNPLPVGMSSEPLLFYRVMDPSGFARRARERFRQTFGEAREGWVSSAEASP